MQSVRSVFEWGHFLSSLSVKDIDVFKMRIVMNCLGPAVSQSEWTLGAMFDQGLKMPTRLYRDIGPYVD